MSRETRESVRDAVATVQAMVVGNPTVSAETVAECLAVLAQAVLVLANECRDLEQRLDEVKPPT